MDTLFARLRIALWIALGTLVALPGPATAFELALPRSGASAPAPEAPPGPMEVDVELVLAVDASLSITPREMDIQRRGYAEAILSPEVMAAVTGGLLGRVAITYMEWAGAGSQRTVIDWTVIASPADARAFAARLLDAPGQPLRRTSISGALDHAVASFEGNGFAGLRRVIDISGDGPNNSGGPVTRARDAALARGIVINGLPLMTREGVGGRWHLDDLDRYYTDCIIGGPGAFVIPVTDWDGFAVAVRRKLVMELAGLSPAPAPPRRDGQARLWRIGAAQAAPHPEPYDCLIGEKIWDSRSGVILR